MFYGFFHVNHNAQLLTIKFPTLNNVHGCAASLSLDHGVLCVLSAERVLCIFSTPVAAVHKSESITATNFLSGAKHSGVCVYIFPNSGTHFLRVFSLVVESII
ncbi:conserved hypothetical protein [Trichinella spiralis]|uniref:hypothetical protein n=1 Tax=Trichinella spiralis TaxID=6334 RepID=UPI0001EFDD4A|nr:conserved hypothetical protein [Trichinella spiralis]